METTFDYYREHPTLPLIAAFGAVYVTYYLVKVVKRPLLACRDVRLLPFLQRHCPVAREKYWPTFWCFGSRSQTVLRALMQSEPKMDYRSEVLRTPDGGQIKLDWLDNEDSSPFSSEHRPTLLLLPGLTGDSQCSYILHMVHDAVDLGYRAVVFNNRGNGGMKLLTPRTYCAANTEDLEHVVAHIKSVHPNAPLVGLGISLGGMILFNYIARMGEKTGLVAGMCISVAWDVFESCKSLESSINKMLFNNVLAQSLTDSLKRNIEVFESHFDMEHVFQSSTIREFDDRFTAKVFGYSSWEAYYREACLHDKIHALKIPVLCLNAADDPFSPLHAIPVDEAVNNDNIAIVVTPYGGHIGFLEGIFPRHKNYMYRWSKQFIKAVFTHGEELLPK